MLNSSPCCNFSRICNTFSTSIDRCGRFTDQRKRKKNGANDYKFDVIFLFVVFSMMSSIQRIPDVNSTAVDDVTNEELFDAVATQLRQLGRMVVANNPIADGSDDRSPSVEMVTFFERVLNSKEKVIALINQQSENDQTNNRKTATGTKRSQNVLHTSFSEANLVIKHVSHRPLSNTIWRTSRLHRRRPNVTLRRKKF